MAITSQRCLRCRAVLVSASPKLAIQMTTLGGAFFETAATGNDRSMLGERFIC